MGIEKTIEEPVMSLPPLPTDGDGDYNINHAKIWDDIQKKHHLVYKGEPKDKKYLIYKGEKYKLVKC